MPKKLNPLDRLEDVNTGASLEVLYEFPNGNLVVTAENPRANRAITVDKYGRFVTENGRATYDAQPRVRNAEAEVVEYLTLYPNGQVYKKSCCPVSHSSYGLENLIQIKVTRRGGKIVDKQFC